jgi:hypothetical protein
MSNALRLRAWTDTALAAARDWRRYAPAVGSVAAHIAVLGAIAATMAVAPSRLGVKPAHPLPQQITVTLVSDANPPMRRPHEPPKQQAAPENAEPLPAPPRRRAERTAPAPSAPPAPAEQAANEPNVEFVPPGPTGVPLGLKSLLETNPCGQIVERMRGDCSLKWEKWAREGNLVYSPTLDRLAEMYPDFRPEPNAAVPGLPGAYEPGLGKSAALGGGKIMRSQGLMPGGPAGGTGIESIGGRLPPKNWQHQDPVFGSDNPRWLGLEPPRRDDPPRPN